MEERLPVVGIFVDVENLTSWVAGDGLGWLILELQRKWPDMPAVVRRAYGKWTQPSLAKLQREANVQGFELVHTYHPVRGKNSADIQMTVDVMEYCGRMPHLRLVVLATGDSDFSPLFRRLREMGRDVIGVGPRSALSDSVKTSCGRYYFTDLLLKANAPAAPGGPSSMKDDEAADIQEAEELLHRVLSTYDGAANVAELKSRMLNLDSAFDERQLGFKNFLSFLQSVRTVVVRQLEDKTTWEAEPLDDVQDSTCGPPSVQPGDSEPASPEMYWRVLKAKGWPPLSVDKQIAAYKAFSAIGEPGRNADLRERALELAGESLTPADIKKAFSVFRKAMLFQPCGDAEAGEWAIKKDLTEDDLLDAINRAKVVRLLRGLAETGREPDIGLVANILSGEQSIEQAARLVRNLEGEEAKESA